MNFLTALQTTLCVGSVRRKAWVEGRAIIQVGGSHSDAQLINIGLEKEINCNLLGPNDTDLTAEDILATDWERNTKS